MGYTYGIDLITGEKYLIADSGTPVGSSGYSGYSGFSGADGILGSSGYSGYSGQSGATGAAGASGYSGATGADGASGYSGQDGVIGADGASGYSGYSGGTGAAGASGYSGISGYSGAAGAASASGYSGYSGQDGVIGADGASGYSGYSGQDGAAGTSGYSGYSGQDGSAGAAGASGYSGYSGISGQDGAAGASGYSGYSGISGATGASGYSGYAQDTLVFPVDINRYGFTDRSDTKISFDGTDTFSISGATWSYYRAGLKHTITGQKTKQVANPMVDHTRYYIYIDSTDGSLSSDVGGWDLNDTKVPVATIYWDSAATPKFIMADERHTCLIDRATHRHEHFIEGTEVVSGGELTGFTYNSSTPADKTFKIFATTIADEDIFLELAELPDPDGATAVYYNVYRTAAGQWTWAASDMPFKYAGTSAPFGYIEYDLSGTSTASQNNKYVNTYLFVSNAVANNEVDHTKSTSAMRYFILQGRNEFSTATNAYGESFGSFDLTGFPVAEGAAMYQLTWSTVGIANTVKGRCQLIRVAKIASNIITTSVSATVSHNTLTGLQGGSLNEYYHLTSEQYDVLPTGVTGNSGYILTNNGLSGYWAAASTVQGTSGYSGYSGISGANGTNGADGASGYSGYSGISGATGAAGTSGYSGYSGNSTSGYSGYSGATAASGYSGYSGISGYSGYSGISGYSGVNGAAAVAGTSGVIARFNSASGIGDSNLTDYMNGRMGYSGTMMYYKPNLLGSVAYGNGGSGMVNNTGEEGRYNTFVGIDAGLANTAGYLNTFIGSQAGTAVVSGYGSVAVGQAAGLSNTSGNYWTAMGLQAGRGNVGGSQWVAIGYRTARYYGDGSAAAVYNNSTYVGTYCKVSASGADNENVFGYSGIGKGSNTVVLGNTNISGTYLRSTVYVNDVAQPKIYVQADAPTSGMATNDLWVDI